MQFESETFEMIASSSVFQSLIEPMLCTLDTLLVQKKTCLPSIDYFRITHDAFCLPPKCCVTYFFSNALGKMIPEALENSILDRVCYGGFEKKEFKRKFASRFK